MPNDDGISRRGVLEKSSGMGFAMGLPSVTGGFEWPWGDDEDEERDDSAADYSGKRPVVFVHGAAGSATQFESQAMRFASNGYPDEYLAAFEYHSFSYGAGSFSGGLLSYLLGGGDTKPSAVHERLDERIDEVLAETGAEKVDLLGHSLGTEVSSAYLSTKERADKVAQYVNLDGFEPDSPPGSVPTLAVWGLSNPDASIGGAENVHFDGQTHVEVATSAETFAEVYEFLTNEEPATTDIEVEPAEEVTLSGRGQVFPSNQMPDDLAAEASIDVYEVDPETGERLSETPVATPSIDDDGYWGPIDVDGSAVHEFVVSLESSDQVHHHYRQPELRSNQFVRLLTSEPGTGIDRLIEKSDDHTALITLRDKEWWGDQGAANDELAVDGTNVINQHTAPRDDRIIAPFVFDDGSDGESNLDDQIGIYGYLPFLSGIDQYVPASSPPDGTVDVTSTPRDGDGLQREFTVPNWASSGHRVSLYFPDHTQTR
ncbi:alpha/beta fold hydrolase [Halorientalis halophila]|uniref:alpha/beta fold hydrolase n=1 Tax=Halorientalis halophila TaxID=3108499 RepID=UPI003008BB3B